MSKYDFIIDEMCFSFSRVNSFFNCPYYWLQCYIFSEDETVNNFFAEFGLFIHLVLEKYFKNELDNNQLLDFYKDNYKENVKLNPPPYPKGMGDNYYEKGIKFFTEFDFDKSEWEIISVEETFFTNIDEYKVVIKPDLRLINKNTKEIYIFDYKTSDMNKKDKFEEAKKQINLYALGILNHYKLEVKKGVVWAIRTGERIPFDITNNSIEEAKEWFIESIEKIKNEDEFKATPKKYFCDNLCGIRNICEFREWVKYR